MSVTENDRDCCPHCHRPLEIAFLKFGFRGVAMIATCPNCGIARADNCRAESVTFHQAEKTDRAFWQKMASRMDELNLRVRHVLAFLFAAVIIAAVLRHVFHVYGGLSREEIRVYALFAFAATGIGITLFWKIHRQ
jgi:hypothetical protein